jgi:hypothetical protein
MTDTAAMPGERICTFIERVERIDEEIKALNEGKKSSLKPRERASTSKCLRKFFVCANTTRTSATSGSRDAGPRRPLHEIMNTVSDVLRAIRR